MSREIKFQKYFEKYEIGNDGSVWSLDYNHTRKRKELKQYLDEDGYPHVFLNNNGKRTKLVIHRAVAKLFLGKPPTDKHQVNHINSKRDDNRIENLEWVTSQENTIHGWNNGRKVTEKVRETSRKLAQIINKKRWGYDHPHLLESKE